MIILLKEILKIWLHKVNINDETGNDVPVEKYVANKQRGDVL